MGLLGATSVDRELFAFLESVARAIGVAGDLLELAVPVAHAHPDLVGYPEHIRGGVATLREKDASRPTVTTTRDGFLGTYLEGSAPAFYRAAPESL
jgi:hypothetical protein